LPTKSKVILKIYNLAGQLIRTLVDGEQPAGIYEVYWNGKDDNGRLVTSGIYFYRIETNTGFRETKKTILLR